MQPLCTVPITRNLCSLHKRQVSIQTRRVWLLKFEYGDGSSQHFFVDHEVEISRNHYVKAKGKFSV
ncbi:hypothetical protein NC652_026594 [Populus alba x Populus x berolinensis]|nr:hypothetical protein NC652_026594 [Populus alba x Populus x berolinensis]